MPVYALGLSDAFQPTLFHLLQFAGFIATQGQIPTLYEEKPKSTKDLTLSLKPETWRLLQSGMRLAARAGTAQGLDPADRLQLAVKTGTVPHGTTYQSWLLGYFPVENPRYAFCVRAPQGTSQDQAVPLARQLLFSRKWP